MRKGIFSIKVLLAFLLVLSSLQGTVVRAFWDSSAPDVTGVGVDKQQVYDGQTITVNIDAVDLQTPIKDADIWYTDGKGYLQTFKGITYNPDTKKLQLMIPISKTSSLGNWSISSIWFNSTNGDFKVVDKNAADLSGGNFQVIEKPDNESPVFTGISIVKSQLTLGDTNTVRIGAQDSQSGVAEVKVGYVNPTGQTLEENAAFNFFTSSYEASIPTLGFSNIGAWQAAYVYLKDKKGNEKTIYNSKLYADGVTSDLSGSSFDVLEDKGDTLDTLNRIRVYNTDVVLPDTVIDGDVYVGSNATLTISGNVTINGDLHIFGSYMVSGSLKVTGTLYLTNELDHVPIFLANQPLTAINGLLNLSGKTLPIVPMTINDVPVQVNSDGTFKLDRLNVAGQDGITVKFTDPSGNVIVRQFLIKQVTKNVPSAPMVNEVTDQDTLVTGTAEAGANVEVKVNGIVIGSGTVGQDSQFTISIPRQTAGTELGVTATDSIGNVSETTIFVVKDATPPAAPKVDEVTNQSVFITGTTEAYAKVIITIDTAAGLSTYTGTADGNGAFKVAIPAQVNGTVITVMASDAAGNMSDLTKLIVEDKTAPAIPMVNDVTDKDVTVSGQTEAGAFVEVKANGTLIGSGISGTDGKFSISIPVQPAGGELKITAADSSGNVSEPVIVVVKDKTPPAKPLVNEVSDKDTQIGGEAETDSYIEVKVNGTRISSGTAGPDGKFYLQIPAQKAGVELGITAADKDGNVSEVAIVVVKDKTAPAKPVVNGVTDQDTTVTGQAESGSFVEIKVNGTTIGSGTAGIDGKFSVTIPVQHAYDTLVVTATDKAGNVSEEAIVGVKDVTPPSKPVVNQVTDRDVRVTGTAEPYTYIEIKVNGSVIGYGYAAADGKFNIIIPVQTAGVELSVTAKDVMAVNISEATTVIVKDATAPIHPSVHEVTDKDKTVTGEAEPGSFVKVMVNGTIIGTSFAGTDGKFSVITPAQKAGVELVVTATDKDGNESESSSVVVRDVTSPNAPVVNDVMDMNRTVTGIAEPGSFVKVMVNGSIIGSSFSGTDGKFSVIIPVQKAGVELVVTATDKDGNESEPTSVVVRDVTSPNAPVVNDVMDMNRTVTGIAEPGSFVVVKVNGTIIGSAAAGSDGKFSVQITAAQAAGTEIVVTATDKAGNESEPKVVIVKDGTSPAKPVVNDVKETDIAVTGKAEVGSTVSLKINGLVIGSYRVGDNGTFSITIPLQPIGTELVLTATDQAGNESESASIIVKDGRAPKAPAVSTFTDQEYIIRGTAEPNSTVKVYINGSLLSTGKAGADGKFAVETPAGGNVGMVFTVTATDAAGNESPATAVVVISKVTGWVKTYYNKWYYIDPQTGLKHYGWLRDAGKWYYLDANGYMKTGWLSDGGTWYYLNGSGAMATGWMKSGTSWYYLKANGAMATGWVKDKGYWYYLKSNGTMATGWMKDKGYWYYLKSSGIMATGKVSISNRWYYFDSNGIWRG